MFSVPLPSVINQSNFQGWLQTYRDIEAEPHVEFELPSSGAFWEPLGIVLFASQLAHREKRGLRSSIRLLKRTDLFEWLLRLGLFDVLNVELPPEYRHTELRPTNVPLIRIETSGIARKLARDTQDFIERQSVIPRSMVNNFGFVFNEIGDNIAFHSEHPDTGFGAAQAFPKINRLQMAFCDSGVGFLASMRKHFEHASRLTVDAEALDLAMQPGMSSSEDTSAHGGHGLHQLTMFCEQMKGRLQVVSGTSMWELNCMSGAGLAETTVVPHHQGAIVVLDVRNRI